MNMLLMCPVSFPHPCSPDFCSHCCFNNFKPWFGMMASWLRYRLLLQRTRVWLSAPLRWFTTTYHSSFGGSEALFLTSEVTRHTCTVHTYMQAKHTFTQNKNNLRSSSDCQEQSSPSAHRGLCCLIQRKMVSEAEYLGCTRSGLQFC